MNYFEKHRLGILLGVCVLILGFAGGFMARPGFDKFSGTFTTKPYVATKVDNRSAIQKAVAEEVMKYKQSSDYQTLIDKIAVEHVGRLLSIDISSLTGEAVAIKDDLIKKQDAQISQHEIREIHGISDATATAVIALETKQGRR
jgi:hypothetical protein